MRASKCITNWAAKRATKQATKQAADRIVGAVGSFLGFAWATDRAAKRVSGALAFVGILGSTRDLAFILLFDGRLHVSRKAHRLHAADEGAELVAAAVAGQVVAGDLLRETMHRARDRASVALHDLEWLVLLGRRQRV